MIRNPIRLARAELYDRVWSEPTVKIAKDLGVSHVAISKICRKMNVPKSPLGYWARIYSGAKIKPTPLPQASAGGGRDGEGRGSAAP